MNTAGILLGTPREWARQVTVAVVIGVFLGVIGPFGNFNSGPLEMRVAYWVIDTMIGLFILSVIVRGSVLLAIRFEIPMWFAVPVGAAVGAAPLSLVIALFSTRFWPGGHSGQASPLHWYGQTLALSEPCAAIFYYLIAGRNWTTGAPRDGRAVDCSAPPGLPTRPPGSLPPSPPAATTTVGARFLDRLPPHLGRDLLCLQMEDHYVRAHTTRGSDLILTPLKDAILELGDIDGLRVHRSFWVSRRAVAGSVANGRNLFLRLTNNIEVPVSRASVAKLRESGWLNHD
jgi:hypothetical protein